MTPQNSPYKSKGGTGRLLDALRYSAQGARAAFQHEAAFRQELLATAVLTPAAFWVGETTGEIVALIGVLFFMLIVELLNSGVEALADAISLDENALIGRAKDLGSAAVMLSIIFATIVWLALIASHLAAR
ncbi:MAG: diacylglycerol kinase [Burkholderiaceae bacterium]